MGRVHARKRFHGSVAGVAFAAVSAAASALPLDAQSRGGGNPDKGAPPGFEETIDQVAADVTIRQWRITSDDGRVASDPPGVAFRFEAERNGAGWRTRLSTTGFEKPSATLLTGPQALDTPFLISRLEYDDDGTPPRMYNARGQLVTGPGEKERRALGL